METDVLKQYRRVNVLHIVQIPLPERKRETLAPDSVSFYFLLLIPPLQPNCLVQSPPVPLQHHEKYPHSYLKYLF